MKYDDLFKAVMNELNSTYIDEEGNELRIYPFEAAYVAGIKDNRVEILFTVETMNNEFVLKTLDVLTNSVPDYEEYIFVTQLFDDDSMETQTTRIHRRADKVDPEDKNKREEEN